MKTTTLSKLSMLIDEKNIKIDNSLDRFLTMEIPFVQEKIKSDQYQKLGIRHKFDII